MKKIKDKVLAEGEVTGHAHRVSVDVYEDKNGLRHFNGVTTVTHEEHKPIVLPEKKMVSGRVNRFDYWQQLDKIVED